MGIDKDIGFKLQKRVRHRLVGDEGIVVNMDTGKVSVVNGVGAHLLASMKSVKSAGELRDSVCQHFDVEPQQAEADIKSYLDNLLEEGIVKLIVDPALELSDKLTI